MAWLGKSQLTCGRPIPKPEKQGKTEEIYEDAIPLQDQIENLRAKISLKERYNKALRDDLNESNQGASTYVIELSRETRELRQQLIDAINSEKAAVQNALRTHREFQLAMTDKTPAFAIPWLDDKLFDMSKCLNSLLYRLKCKRKKLDEAEEMVTVIQQWPRPGTLPWEMDAVNEFNRLECEIEAQKVKRETAFIIHEKYVEIKFQLLAERGKYTSLLKNMESGLRILKNELAGLETMLDDAIYFRNETYKNLILTEKEASENRKRRRIQMAKMKKAVEKILEENQRAPANNHAAKMTRSEVSQVTNANGMTVNEIADILRAKRAEVEEFQMRARRLVEIMRVPDLTHIPIRLRTVATIGERLKEEQASKEKLRDLFLKQKAQLQLILYYFRYTGAAQLEAFEAHKKEYETGIEEAQKKIEVMNRRLNRIGDVIVQLRLGMMSIMEQLSEGKKRPPHAAHEDMRTNMRVICEKLRKMAEANQEMEDQFHGQFPEKNYTSYVKQPPQQTRLVRVGSPHVSEDSDEDDDMIDSKVPSRAEIKAKSARILNQANLKRGIRTEVIKPIRGK